MVCTLDSRGFRHFRGFRDFRYSITQLLVWRPEKVFPRILGLPQMGV